MTFVCLRKQRSEKSLRLLLTNRHLFYLKNEGKERRVSSAHKPVYFINVFYRTLSDRLLLKPWITRKKTKIKPWKHKETIKHFSRFMGKDINLYSEKQSTERPRYLFLPPGTAKHCDNMFSRNRVETSTMLSSVVGKGQSRSAWRRRRILSIIDTNTSYVFLLFQQK